MGRPPLHCVLRRAAAALLTAVAVLLGLAAFGLGATGLGAGVAHAENDLASSNPADGASLGSSPTSIVFTFAEALGATNTVVATCNGAVFPLGSTSVSPDGLSLSVVVVNPMPKGSCSVNATVSSAADQTPNGSFTITFTITADTAATTGTTIAPSDTTAAGAPTTTAEIPGLTTNETAAEPPKVGGPLGLARLATALGLAALLGSLVLIVTKWPEGIEYILTVRFLRTAWVVALAGSILTVVFLTSQVTGRSIGGSLSPIAWFDLKDSTPGLAALARVALAAGSGWTVLRPERCLEPTSQLPAIAVPALAVATLGFSRTGGDLAAVGVLVGVLHALAMAVWLGGLLLLTRVVLAGPGDEDLVHAVRGYSRLSTPALLVTVVTGGVQTFRLDRGALFDTGHGRVLLLKAVLVGATVFVGLITKQFVAGHVGRGDGMPAPLAARLRRATGIEALGGTLVLVLTAWLLSLAPGGITAAANDDGDYGYRSGSIVANDLDVEVDLTGVVGQNAVRVSVNGPVTGLSQLTIDFKPPASTTAFEVLMELPQVTGAGVAVLPVEQGIPLGAAGVWTIQISATTPTGAQTVTKTFTLLG